MLFTLFASFLALLPLTIAHLTHRTYTFIPSIFQQSIPTTNATTFNFTTSNFGLIPRRYPTDASLPYPSHYNTTQWQRLNHYITSLNLHAPKHERYVLFFLGRHGEGYHNAAESYFGTPAWNCYYSFLDGNETVTWADAHLTATGITQALVVNKFWAQLIKDEKITPPQSYYTSPLYRSLDTARLTFSNLTLPRHSPFKPVVKEGFREGISAHTCDRRSNRTYITTSFPDFKIENGFPEEDPSWTPLRKETPPGQDIRSRRVLDDVLSTDLSTYISITSHSGEIASLLRVFHHRPFSLSTGASIPILVKATTHYGTGPPTETLPFVPDQTCANPPLTRDPGCNDCSCCL